MLSPTDLVDELAEAFVRNGMDVFPSTVYNGQWHFTFKKWRQVVNWTSEVLELSDSSDLEVVEPAAATLAAAAPTTEGEEDYVRPKRPPKKKRVNPATIDYTQVTNVRDAQISSWANDLGFEFKDGRICVKALWKEIANEYILSLSKKVKGPNRNQITRRWQRWVGLVQPDSDLHRVSSAVHMKCSGALIVVRAGPDHPHRPLLLPSRRPRQDH